MFGGTIGTASAAEHKKYEIGIFSGSSTAMNEHAKAKKDSLKNAVAAVDELNKKSG